MSDFSLSHETPAGPPMGLTPILVVDNAHAAIDFYTAAFAAKEIARVTAPDGRKLMHARMEVFGSILVLMDDFPELEFSIGRSRTPQALGGSPVTLHLQVEDASSLWEQALRAGASAVIPLQEVFWGELYGRLRDPFGHEWTVAQQLRKLSALEVERAAVASMKH